MASKRSWGGFSLFEGGDQDDNSAVSDVNQVHDSRDGGLSRDSAPALEQDGQRPLDR